MTESIQRFAKGAITVRTTYALTVSALLVSLLIGCSSQSAEPSPMNSSNPPASGQPSGGTAPAPSQAPVNLTSVGTVNPSHPKPDDAIVGWNKPGVSVGLVNYKNEAYRLSTIERIAGKNGFTVRGQLRAFEAVGQLQVTDLHGNPIPQKNQISPGVVSIHASAGAPAWGDFAVQVTYPPELRGTVATLKFYVISAKDGSKQDMLTIHVKLE